MNAAADFEDRWLDDILSAPPAEIPDAGFTARVMRRIRIRHRIGGWFRGLVLGGLGALGTLIAVRFTSLEAIKALLPGGKIAEVLDALPAIHVLPAFEAADYTSPIALAVLAAAFLTWLVREAA